MHDLFQEQKNKKTVAVLIPLPVPKAYDYVVPDDLEVGEGDYVVVPLGKRPLTGVVWGKPEGKVAPEKLKAVTYKYPAPPMTKTHREFLEKLAAYTMSPLGFVLKLSLSARGALDPPKPVMLYHRTEKPAGKVSDIQQKLLDVLAGSGGLRATEAANLAGCSAGVLKTLEKKGLIESAEQFPKPPCRAADINLSGQKPVLSEDQQSAAALFHQQIEQNAFSCALLDGVTGAGKTEVYFEAVAKSVQKGKQVLILLPEIALSNAFLERFRSRFGCAPALWHSDLPESQRKTTWRGVASGKTQVVIGARSALMLPYKDLGLIVVDEEHDPAYKQEEGVLYHARDMAVLRAHMGNFPVILVSATPSLETMHNVWAGRYQHAQLTARHGGAVLPDISLIDMREDKPESQKFLSPALIKAMVETLERKEQVLLFLNRRGYAPLTLCRSCGHRMQCPRCTAWLVEHKSRSGLQCHHCGYGMQMPHRCPSCKAEESLTPCGPGVERIYEEAIALFPDQRVRILASDTAENPGAFKEALQAIEKSEVDIIVGTQIIAKGYHFPGLTCVGVVDADLGLNGGELRASERTYQLLHQVAGRAGRADKAGTVYLQTFMPEHKIMQALATGDRDTFLQTERLEREAVAMPPYRRLAGIIISGRDENQVIEIAKKLGQTAPQAETVQTFGPAPAPMARIRGRYRYRLLVRAEKNVNIQKTIEQWLSSIKAPSTVRVTADIDPQSFI